MGWRVRCNGGGTRRGPQRSVSQSGRRGARHQQLGRPNTPGGAARRVAAGRRGAVAAPLTSDVCPDGLLHRAAGLQLLLIRELQTPHNQQDVAARRRAGRRRAGCKCQPERACMHSTARRGCSTAMGTPLEGAQAGWPQALRAEQPGTPSLGPAGSRVFHRVLPLLQAALALPAEAQRVWVGQRPNASIVALCRAAGRAGACQKGTPRGAWRAASVERCPAVACRPQQAGSGGPVTALKASPPAGRERWWALLTRVCQAAGFADCIRRDHPHQDRRLFGSDVPSDPPCPCRGVMGPGAFRCHPQLRTAHAQPAARRRRHASRPAGQGGGGGRAGGQARGRACGQAGRRACGTLEVESRLPIV